MAWKSIELGLDNLFKKTGYLGNHKLFSGKIGKTLDSIPVVRWFNSGNHK